MDHKRMALWLAVSLLLAGLLAGCGQSRLQVGMKETHRSGHWQASYVTLSGVKQDTLRAGAGQTLVLDYDVEVDNGTLGITVSDPENQALWDVSLHERARDAVHLDLDEGGSYTIRVEGDGAGGSFDLAWELE